MKCSAQNNVGIRPKQAEVIPVEVERDLWEQGFLATNDPESLLRTVFYLIGRVLILACEQVLNIGF